MSTTTSTDIRPISCVDAEERLFALEPAEAAAAAEGQGEPELAGHLGRCEACHALAADLSLLAPLGDAPRISPAPAIVEQAFLKAAAEAAALAAARRAAALVAGAKAALAFVLCLPLIGGFNAGLAALGVRYLPAFLPEGALFYVGGVFGALVLAGLSAVAFLLTLVAGAAGRPPRDELVEA